jgi:carbon-monoxide dehydrogenase large subunit
MGGTVDGVAGDHLSSIVDETLFDAIVQRLGDAMSNIPNISFVGRSISRREDQRLLIGRGQFIADLKLPQMLHAVFVRSPLAHARIKAIDLSRAAASPGIIYALSGPELARQLPPVPDTQLALPSKWTTLVQHKFINPQQPLLAYDKVRHVGEAVAVMLAETQYAAEDAAELVRLDLEPLPPVLDPETALRPDATLIHDRFGTNLIGGFTVGKGEIDSALALSPHRLQRRFYHHRYAAMPMECRGVVGLHDPRTDSVTIWSATQVVHWVRREAAAVLKLPEARVRCIALDVGGGFGVKGHLSGRSADPVSSVQARTASPVDRGPPRTFAVLLSVARPDSRSGCWLRRRRSHSCAA